MEQAGSIFDLSKVTQMTNLKIYISSHGEARNIKFRPQVNFIQSVLLGALPREVVTQLPHNHVTAKNLFISSYRGAIVIKFGR